MKIVFFKSNWSGCEQGLCNAAMRGTSSMVAGEVATTGNSQCVALALNT